MNKHLTDLPEKILLPFHEYQKASDAASKHKALLGLGESVLVYLVGILFGEYKRSGQVVDAVETEFYRQSGRKPSLGHFLSFLRLLSKHVTGSILSPQLNQAFRHQSFGEFIKEFDLLKQVIDQGADSEFSALLEPLRKGQTAGAKTVIEFYDTFIVLRNIFAHPEDKAGKEIKRKWPLHSDYFAAINPLLEKALTDLIDLFDQLFLYRPVLMRLIDDQQQKAVVTVEVGSKSAEKELSLSAEEIGYLTTNIRYLLDEHQRIFIQLYYHIIPAVNGAAAQRIIESEKAKERLPILKELIYEKLINDQAIDELEWLILRDTAKSNYISTEKLFELIEQARVSLGINAEAGTPESPGNLFVKSKEWNGQTIIFNPWLLKYFSLVPRFSKETIREENEYSKSIRDKISELSKSIRSRDKKNTSEQGKIEEEKKELMKLEEQYNRHYEQTIWGQHRNVWKECNQFVSLLLDKNLNRSASEGTLWVNTQNSWQIGQLSYIYWAKIHPETAPLGEIVHTGLAICNEFKWVPRNVDKTIKEKLRKPGVIMWTSVDDLALERLNLNDLHQKGNFNQEMVNKYEKELMGLGVMVKIREVGLEPEDPDQVDLLVPLENYIQQKEQFTIRQVYSRIWNLEDFFPEGIVDMKAVAAFEKEMVTLLQLFSNAVEMANEFALQQGIDAENIAHREDIYQRLRKYLNGEFKQTLDKQELFTPEQMHQWKQKAMIDYGCRESVFNKIFNQFQRSLKN
jgi:hypothetical protein